MSIVLSPIISVPAAQPQSAGPFTTQSSSNQNSRRKEEDRDSYQAPDPIPSAGSRTVDTDGDTDAPFVIIFTLPKCLGSNEAKKLIRELKTKLTGEPHLVIVDLPRVTEMDCAGLDGLLVCMHKWSPEYPESASWLIAASVLLRQEPDEEDEDEEEDDGREEDDDDDTDEGYSE